MKPKYRSNLSLRLPLLSRDCLSRQAATASHLLSRALVTACSGCVEQVHFLVTGGRIAHTRVGRIWRGFLLRLNTEKQDEHAALDVFVAKTVHTLSQGVALGAPADVLIESATRMTLMRRVTPVKLQLQCELWIVIIQVCDCRLSKFPERNYSGIYCSDSGR
jgi:hypothetical protein